MNISFLRAASPNVFLFCGVGVWAFLLLIAPLAYPVDLVSWAGVAFVVACYAGLGAGAYLGARLGGPAAAESIRPDGAPPRMLLDLAILISIAGIVLRVVDRVFVRGAALDVRVDLSEIRASLDTQASIYAVIGSPLYVWGLLCLPVAMTMRPGSVGSARWLLIAAMFSYPTLEGLVAGSRSVAMISLLLLLVWYQAWRSGGKGLLPLLARGAVVAVVGAVLLVFMQDLFVVRTFQLTSHASIQDIYELAGFARYASPQPWVSAVIAAAIDPDPIERLFLSLVHMLQYFTHSIFAYFENYEAFSGNIGWGEHHLWLATKIWSTLTGRQAQAYNALNEGMLEGIWGTGFRHLLYDFGWMAPIVCVAVGWTLARLHAACVRRPGRWLPFYGWAGIVLFLMPMEQMIVGGFGSYSLLATLAYAAAHAIFPGRSVVVEQERAAEERLRDPGGLRAGD